MIVQQGEPQGKHAFAKSHGNIVSISKPVLPQTLGVAQLVEDDILMGPLPHSHRVALQGNSPAQNLSCLVEGSSLHCVADKRCEVHRCREAISGAHDGLAVVPHRSKATSGNTSIGSQSQSGSKAKVALGVASSSAKSYKATTSAGMVVRQKDEHIMSRVVVDASSKDLIDEDILVKSQGTHVTTDPVHRANPVAAKRLLEHTGSSNDRGRALPKAAAMLRGFKGQEDEGLERVPSNLSVASASSIDNPLFEVVRLSHQVNVKAGKDAQVAHLGVSRVHASTSRPQAR